MKNVTRGTLLDYARLSWWFSALGPVEAAEILPTKELGDKATALARPLKRIKSVIIASSCSYFISVSAQLSHLFNELSRSLIARSSRS